MDKLSSYTNKPADKIATGPVAIDSLDVSDLYEKISTKQPNKDILIKKKGDEFEVKVTEPKFSFKLYNKLGRLVDRFVLKND